VKTTLSMNSYLEALAYVVALVAALPSGSALADTIDVHVDTTALSGSSATLAFDFIDGDGLVNNSLSIENFQSDAVIGPESTTGDVTGAFPGTVKLSDTQFFNELLLPATLGSSISFKIDYTNAAGSPPDSLSLFLLDAAAINSLVTTNLSGDALLEIDMNGSHSGAVLLPSAISPGVGITVASSSPTLTPEPRLVILLCVSLLSMACVRGLRDRNRGGAAKGRPAHGNTTHLLVLAAIVLLESGIVSAQNLPSLDSDLQVTLSGIVFDRTSNTFGVRATLSNTSTSTLMGPISFVVTSTTPTSVFLANATCRTAQDQPLLVANFPAGGLLPGASMPPITLQFNDPLRATFTFTQTVLAGDQCTSQLVFRAFSDAAPLPDDATLLQAMQLSQPLLCMIAASVNPMTLSQAMTSIQQNVDQFAGPGALKSFLASVRSIGQDELSTWATAALFQQGGLGALVAFLAAHQNDPQNPIHLVNAAGVAGLIGLPNEALAMLDAADALGGNFGSPMGINGRAVALNNRGFALSRLGQWSQAQPFLANAMSMEPLLAEARTNLGIAMFCQGNSSAGEKNVRAGMRRSPEDLRYDQIFDLSAGVAPNLPHLPYPAIASQIEAFQTFYQTYVPDIYQHADDLQSQSTAIGQQILQQELQNPLPPLDSEHVLDVSIAFGRIRRELWDDQTPPGLANLWSNVLATQQAGNNLASEASNQFGILLGQEPLPCCDPKTGMETSAHAAWRGKCQGSAKGLLTQFLFTQGHYEQASRAFSVPWYKAMTGLAADVSHPLYNQVMGLSAQSSLTSQFGDVADTALGIMTPLAAIWQLGKGSLEVASPPSDEPASAIPPPCPPELWGGRLTYSIFGFGVGANCDGISASIDSPGIKNFLGGKIPTQLPIVAKVNLMWNGPWTLFTGVKVSAGPVSITPGFIATGNGQSITGFGFSSASSLGAGPFKLGSNFQVLVTGAPSILGNQGP
jgi:tetratricopeptide (TPR) repeat protein